MCSKKNPRCKPALDIALSFRLLKNPSIRYAGKSLRMVAPPQLEEFTRPNLAKKIRELFESGSELSVTDATLPLDLRLVVTFDDV